MVVAAAALGILIILLGLSIVRATDWRDRPKPRLSVKPQHTVIAEEVITVSRRRTVKATKGN